MLLITDLDNTLYNFIDYYGPCFRAMVHALSERTGVPEDDLICNFRDVYARHGSVEYSFAVQEMECFNGRSAADIEDLIDLAMVAFSRARLKRLRPYPGVEEGLLWAKMSGIKVIGITNAPMWHALKRLGQLNIAQYFSGVAAYRGHDVPGGNRITDKIKRFDSQGFRSSIKKRWLLERHELKPSPVGYQRILSDANSCSTYVIGDSREKDLAPAIALGSVGIWARYGTTYDAKNMETLLQVTHWTSDGIKKAYDQVSIEPDYTIDNFGDIRKLLPQFQQTMFF